MHPGDRKNGVAAMDLQLKDKTAVVTGSTGGIGFAIARRPAVEGAKGFENAAGDFAPVNHDAALLLGARRDKQPVR